jgi:signal transduction histidine kinase
MVVQAGAAQYLAGQNTPAALVALDSITEAAREAEAEIGRLVAVLGEPADQPAPTIDDIVSRARATGLPVSYEFVGDAGRVPTQTVDTVYRIVREAVTNALKHAPGAPVSIALSCTESAIQLRISNAPPRATRLDLESTGGGHGLGGIRERVAACGGELTIGLTEDGGWQVMAELPLSASASI